MTLCKMTIFHKDVGDKKFLLIITDDEWDFCPLKDAHGAGFATKEKVSAKINEVLSNFMHS